MSINDFLLLKIFNLLNYNYSQIFIIFENSNQEKNMFCWGSTVNGELGLGGCEVEKVLLPEFNDFDQAWNIKQGIFFKHELF